MSLIFITILFYEPLTLHKEKFAAYHSYGLEGQKT